MVARSTPQGTMFLQWDGHNRMRAAPTAAGAEVYFYDHLGARMLAVSQSEGVRFWFGESETHYTLAGAQTRRYLHLSSGGTTVARVESKTKVELHYADAL